MCHTWLNSIDTNIPFEFVNAKNEPKRLHLKAAKVYECVSIQNQNNVPHSTKLNKHWRWVHTSKKMSSRDCKFWKCHSWFCKQDNISRLKWVVSEDNKGEREPSKIFYRDLARALFAEKMTLDIPKDAPNSLCTACRCIDHPVSRIG